MEYVFKEKITYKEYIDFIKSYDYLSYTQEELWAKAKEIKNYLVVGVYGNKKLIGVSLILIKKNKECCEFVIPNGYLLDFTNQDLVVFMTTNIIKLAKYYNACVLNIYPNITHEDPNYETIHNNLEILLKHNKKPFDNSKNLLIPLKHNNRKISKKDLDSMFIENDYYLKRGIKFEISETINDLDDFEEFINYDYFDSKFIGTMMYVYKNSKHY